MSLYKLLTLPLHRLRLPPPKSFDGQTVLITGANTGLGREAARQALELGASTVIMGVRTLSKGEAAKQDIIRKSTSTGVVVRPEAIEVWQLDMESFESVKSFASRAERYVKTGGGRLDVAIMNAGVATRKFVQTPEDGWERSLQVNCLSTTLLSLRLLPLLQHSNSKSKSSSTSVLPHLVIVASDIHAIAPFPERTAPNILQALNDREQWEKGQARKPAERYAVTKLLDHFIAIEPANMVTSSNQDGATPSVIVNSLTPGFCKSDLMSPSRGAKAPLPLRVMQWLVARDVTEGAKPYVAAAVQGVSSHGKWLENQVVAE
jgi:NAD(P)-dependent dehydrogenase (short-subunit alcohol dehydrogenase family)